MDSNFGKSELTNQPSKPARQQKKPLKLLVFKIGKLNLALQLNWVTRILNNLPVYSSGLSYFGIAHVDNREVTVIDLHQHLFKSRLVDDTELYSYLIIAQNQNREEFGIPLMETPNLMDINRDNVRVLPESYRRSDTLAIASHVAVIPQPSGSMTIFILDVNALLI